MSDQKVKCVQRVLLKKGQKFVAPQKVKGERFDYPATQVGVSTWKGSDGKPITIWYDKRGTGATGLAAAKYVVEHIDELMEYNDWAFGIKGQGGNVIVAPNFGGAYHYGCDFDTGADWYCSVGSGELVLGLAQAEITESYMGLAAAGWNCGGSGGEALSRYLAEIATGGPEGAMTDYQAGPSWDGRNWIDNDSGTDQDYPSTGCGVLYLWWLTKQGYTVDQITQAGESDGTLRSNWAKVTGQPASGAYHAFRDAVAEIGGPGSMSSDNAWGADLPPYPLGSNPPPPPPPPPPPGSVIVIDPAAKTITVPTGWTTNAQGAPQWEYTEGESGPLPASVSIAGYTVRVEGPGDSAEGEQLGAVKLTPDQWAALFAAILAALLAAFGGSGHSEQPKHFKD